MPDKLNLLKNSIPLQIRYDEFVRWTSSINHSIPELMAHELGVKVSTIDVFFQLGGLEDYEFAVIDRCKLDTGMLFVFIRHTLNVRLQVYKKAKILLRSEHPLLAISKYVESLVEVDLDAEILSISKKAMCCISKYLEDRGIDENVLNKNFRKMIKKNKLSDKMIDWILQAIVYDREKSKGVFTNDILKTDHFSDYKRFRFITESIYKLIS